MGEQQHPRSGNYDLCILCVCMCVFYVCMCVCVCSIYLSKRRVTRALSCATSTEMIEITVKSIKMRLRKSRTFVHTYITSKRIELESPCWSGFEAFRIFFKTCATGAF